MDTTTKTSYKLAFALKEMLEKQPLDKINVKDIVTLAGVSRQTFYRHFLDKYDLTNWYFERLVEDSFRQMGVSLTLAEGLLNKFNFIKAEQIFFACAFSSSDANSLLAFDYEYIHRFYSEIIQRKTGTLPTEEVAFLLEMYCRASIQVTAQWAVSGMHRSPADMVKLLIEAMPSRLEALLHDLGVTQIEPEQN